MPKNFRSIPSELRQRIQTFALDDVVAACAKLLRTQDVSRYGHLGLKLMDGQLNVPPPFVPDPRAGRYSLVNVEGKELIRRDLPMIQREFCFYAPNWGDASNGMHLVCNTRDVYRRDFIPPKEVELEISLLEIRDDGFLVKFAVNQVLNRRSADFDSELLCNLNILQENVGAVDVFASEATLADYAATIRVDWELLPVGQLNAPEALNRLLRGKRPVTAAQRAVMEERLIVFGRLRPTHFIAGSSGFIRYFWCQIRG
jgi:hypothetical protein